MEGQQRANAAQLAARSIKQPKGRQRKTPLKPTGNVQQSMQFGGSGGLFGGLAPPTSSFEFSAPGGPSFPPPSFGNGNTSGNSFSSPDISENEADPRADTTGEELLRRHRGFQMGNDQPALFHTPDSFGGTQSTNTNPFRQASTQEQPANNPFSFKPSMPQQPAPSVFNFNSTSTAKTDSSPFAFQSNTSKQPAPSAISFNSTATQNQPAGNPFSFLSAQPAPPTAQPIQDKPGNNIFSGMVQPAAHPIPDKTGHNIFGGLAQPAAPSSVFNFGSPTPADKSASASAPFAFGQSSAKQPPPPGIDTGAVTAADKPASTLFGAPEHTAPAGGAFSFGQSTTQPNIFTNVKFPASPAHTLFGNQSPAPNSSNIFGGQGQQPNADGTAIASNELSLKCSMADKPKSQPTPTNLFANVGKAAPAATGQISSPSKEAASATNSLAGLNGQTTSTPDLFGHLNKPVQQKFTQPESVRSATNDTNSANASTLGVTGAASQSLFVQSPSTNVDRSSKPLFSTPVSPIPTFAPSTPTSSFGAPNPSPTTAATSVNRDSTLFSLNKPVDTPKGANQPAPSALPEPTQWPPKIGPSLARPTSSAAFASPNTLASNSTQKVDNSHLYREMAAAARITDEFMRPLVPVRFSEEQRKEFYVAYRMRCLNKAMQGFFATLAMGSEISNAIAYYQEQRVVIMDDNPTSTTYEKTSAVADREQEFEASAMQNQDSRIPTTQATNPQVAEASVSTSGNSNHLFSMGITSPGPVSQHAATFAPPTKGKRKAEVQLTKDNEEREEHELRQMKTPKFNTATPSGSTTSIIFKSIVDSPAKATPEKKLKLLPLSSEDDTPRFNPFANLPLPASSEGPKPTAPATSSDNLFTLKQASETNLFAPKATWGTSTTDVTDSKPQAPIKPPTFTTGPANFMAQFSQQASKSEEKLMEEAKAEDMDSDDDELEWEARWREKRKAELKAIEELGKSKRATFTAGKFTFGQADKLDNPKVSTPTASSTSPEKIGDPAQPPSKPLFGLKSAVQSSGDSMSSSATGSRTPTPGIAGSNSGSVLDGYVPGKPVSFVQNIFGHLSDADSGADIRKDGNQESDSADEETDNEEDSENKDPSYKPGSEQSSSRTSPEEVGQGNVPVKKPLFDSAASKTGGYSGATPNSGTSTPGGSLFDRITRDSSGNPVRQVSSDEKENTQPSSTAKVANTTNPFARSFDGTAPDQTWKPNSPIKFGAPTVNVMVATPTKPASPFANLFGNSGSSGQPSSSGGSPKPTSNLFAGLATSKSPGSAGVGFNFGSGLSTTTSSLLPSAAASATTSRATSPGGTTDGDSAAEGDPDAENYEQINLTTTGPGEEDEEVLHEIRAKALQWSSKEGAQWQTRGVGPLRVLKHKDTGATRILLRADPSGTIVLNKTLLAGVKYDVNEKTIKFPAAGEPGKGLETWLLQLKTPQFAHDLGKVLEDNKSPS